MDIDPRHVDEVLGDDPRRAAAARSRAPGRQPVAARLHRPRRAGAHRRQPRQPPLGDRARPGREGPARRAVPADGAAVHVRRRRAAARHRPPAGAGDGVGAVPGRAPRRGARHRHPDDHRSPRRQRPARLVRLDHPGGVELLPRAAGEGPGHHVGHRRPRGRGEGEGDPRHPRPHDRDRAVAGGMDEGHRVPSRAAAPGASDHLLRSLRHHVRARSR